MKINGDEVLAIAKSIEPDIINWRRKVHRYPELGMDTPRTSAFIKETLESMGIEVRSAAGYGVVGTLKGLGNRTIALRADIDALPVTEETGLPYASEVPGQMHACGHDAHVAIVLGAAKILSRLRGHLNGNVRFIFQPGEEGPGGAQPMIDDGVLESPKVDAIIGGHVGMLWPVESGQFGFKSGPLMAATDSFTIAVRGKGGHGATPNQCIDPVVIAAQIVLGLQAIVSREVNPISPAVVTIGKIEAGTRNNIIPQECIMQGTVRYFEKNLEQFIPQRMKEIVEGIAGAMRGELFWPTSTVTGPLSMIMGLQNWLRMQHYRWQGLTMWLMWVNLQWEQRTCLTILKRFPVPLLPLGQAIKRKIQRILTTTPNSQLMRMYSMLPQAFSPRHVWTFWLINS